MADRLVVFDMDGVLVDVTESYRETIQQTVEHFTGKRVTREHIQDWKNRGGWNDDWALSTAITRAEGVEVEHLRCRVAEHGRAAVRRFAAGLLAFVGFARRRKRA